MIFFLLYNNVERTDGHRLELVVLQSRYPVNSPLRYNLERTNTLSERKKKQKTCENPIY